MLQDPKFIRGADINDTVVEALRYIMNRGKEIHTRNGSARFVNDLTLQIDNPQRRHLSLDGRKYNIYQLMAETFWVASGSGEISPFLEFFLPRAKNYSDDGKVWAGAYGPRMLAHGQLEDLIATFRREGLSTRRAILMIADPTIDNLTAIKEKYDTDTPKDIPCFVAGTRVFTLEHAWTNIEDVLEGDRVLSFDNEKNTRYQKVTFSGKTGVKTKLVKVHLKNEDSFTCTPEHLIYVKRKGGVFEQVQAKDLKEGENPLQTSITKDEKGY